MFYDGLAAVICNSFLENLSAPFAAYTVSGTAMHSSPTPVSYP